MADAGKRMPLETKNITDRPNQPSRFDIKNEGKVVVTRCEAIYRDVLSTAVLEWELPDLGSGKYDYVLDAIQVFVRTHDSEKKECQVIDKRKITPMVVELEETYVFTIECKYTGIDKSIIAMTTAEINTTLQLSVFEGIGFGEQIVVKWRRAKGSTKHKLGILCSNRMIWSTTELMENEHTIDNDRTFQEGLRYGKIWTFRLEARGANGTMDITEKEILFGGPQIATDVIAKAEKRSVTITWEPPDLNPDSYVLELFDGVEEDPCAEFICEDLSITTHTFTDLKSDTQYFCKSYPVFKRNARGNPTISNTVTTEKRILYPLEKDKKKFGAKSKCNGNIRHEIGNILRDSKRNKAPLIK